MKETIDPKQVEKQLIPRLKKMGYLLLLFALITIGYRFTIKEPTAPKMEILVEEEEAGFFFLDDDEEAFLPTHPKSYYLFSSVFASIGLLCLIFARRKETRFSQEE